MRGVNQIAALLQQEGVNQIGSSPKMEPNVNKKSQSKVRSNRSWQNHNNFKTACSENEACTFDNVETYVRTHGMLNEQKAYNVRTH